MNTVSLLIFIDITLLVLILLIGIEETQRFWVVRKVTSER